MDTLAPSVSATMPSPGTGNNTSLEKQLLRIPDQYVEQIHVLLQWLAYGNEPSMHALLQFHRHMLTLEQLTDTTSISPRAFSVDPVRRMSPDVIVDLLKGVVEVHKVGRNRAFGDDAKVAILKFVDGIDEELLSQEFTHGPASRFSFNERQAKETIAITCLSVILSPAARGSAAKYREAAEMYSLYHFAALFWTDFLDLNNLSRPTVQAIEQLFLRDRQAFETWIAILKQAEAMYQNSKHSSMLRHMAIYSEETASDYAPPLVWASALNLSFLVETLLADGCPINECGKQGVSALYMAVQQKNYFIASLLLEAGGDVADGYQELTGRYEYSWKFSPLYLAALDGHSREWIHLLLKDKSKIGKPGWRTEVASRISRRARLLRDPRSSDRCRCRR